MNEGSIVWVVLAIFLPLFFLPTIIAFRRGHANRWLIFVLNFLFGGTGLGWLGTLIWSLHAVHRAKSGWTGGESGLNVTQHDATLHDRMIDASGSLPVGDLSKLESLKSLLDQGAIDRAEY